MAQIARGSYLPLASSLFNATTSAINFGTSPIALAGPQSTIVFCYPIGSGENGFSWMWSRANGTTDGQRFFIDHNAGSPRVSFVASSATVNSPIYQGAANSVKYNAWNHLAFSWNGDVGAGSDTSFMGAAANWKPLASVTSVGTAGSGSATTRSADNFIIGNSSNGTRTFNGYIAYVARWSRFLNRGEFRTAQMYGPLAVPSGLVFCWANGHDYGPHKDAPTSLTAIATGVSPTGRGLLLQHRRVWTTGSGPAVPGSGAFRWFLST